MSALLNGGSRQWRPRVRGRMLLIFIAITSALLNTPGSTPGIAQQTCCTDITIYKSVINDLPAVDCETAMTKAYRKAIQAVKDEAATIVCPQECPILKEVTPPHITCGPECTPIQVNGYTRWDGTADASGTYRCSP